MNELEVFSRPNIVECNHTSTTTILNRSSLIPDVMRHGSMGLVVTTLIKILTAGALAGIDRPIFILAANADATEFQKLTTELG